MNSPAKSICIVVLNWNEWKYTEQCVRSLQQLDYPGCRVVIVDNHSTDDSVEQLRKALPDVVLLETEANLGFAGGCNRGIRHALENEADYVWLLNNDAVVAPDSLRRQIEMAESTETPALIGSTVFDLGSENTIQTIGGASLNSWTAKVRDRLSSQERLDYLIGASILIPRTILQTVGLLDDWYFFYWEDADFCRRAEAAGFPLLVARDSRVYHRRGGSSEDGQVRYGRTAEADFHLMRGAARYLRHYERWKWPIPLTALFLKSSLLSIRRKRGLCFNRIPVLLRGLLSGLRRQRLPMNGLCNSEMTRVAMLEPSGRGGLCHHSYNLCRALAEQGCQTHLITAEPYELESLPHSFQVSKFRMRTISGLVGCLRRLRALRPDVVHYQATNLHPFFEWVMMKASGIVTGAPFVVAAHEVIPHISPGWQKRFIGMKLRAADAVVVHSENTRREALETCNAHEDNLHVVPVGDYQFLRDFPVTTPQWPKLPGVKDVLFFGGIMSYKGLIHLIRAVGKLKQAGHSVRLAIVGRPVDPWEEYAEEIHQAGLDDNVLTRLAFIDTGEIPGYFRFADVVCVPYLFCSESAVLLAADALDIPVVATSVGGNVAAYEQGMAQELVPPGDEEALAAALERTLFHLDREEYLRKKISRDDSERDWSRIAKRTTELYKSLGKGMCTDNPSLTLPDTGTEQAGLPLVTVLIPARNEEQFIAECLTDVMSGEYPQDRLEVLILDGCSSDRTVQIVEELARERGWASVKVVGNPGRIQSRAMNLGIELATGEYICRIDAHCSYPPDYIPKLVCYLQQHPEVYNVAGLLKVKPSGNSPTAVAIATAYSSKFATGNASQRVGVSKPTYVDTVGLGLYRKEAFDKFGVFDTELLRAEDQEMNCRINKGGGKVLCVPDVSFDYYVRATYGLFARMFYQYGLFKPLAARKMGKPLALRHFVPFTGSVVSAVMVGCAAVTGSLWPMGALLAFAFAYLTLSCVSAVGAVRDKAESLALVPRVCLAFWTAHSCFAIGNVVGLFRFVLFRRKPADIGVSR